MPIAVTFDPLRIALVILHGDPARGGAERYTADLAAALVRRGHEVTLIASSFAPDQMSEAAPIRSVILAAAGGSRLGQYMRFLDKLDQHLSGHSYDIVHAMLPVRQCDIYHPHAGIAAEAVRSGHLKYEGPMMQVVSQMANRMNLKRRRFAAIERALLTGAQPPIVLCLSEYTKQSLIRHHDVPSTRLKTLFNAIDLVRFDPTVRPAAGTEIRARWEIAHDRIVALMIAQDFHRKGLAEAIGALAAAKDDRLALLVVGKQNPASYRRLAERLGVADRVIFAGTTDDPYAYYRAADFFILPTRHDPCSLVVLEALAMGLPVISTIFNGACEIMENQKQGFVLSDPADLNASAHAMKSMLDDASRAAMARECLALRPRLAYDRHLDDLLATYEIMRSSAIR
jgi:UDP-glucose:(heptosyl)LPS alpha-1,3-glucosyltransferase